MSLSAQMRRWLAGLLDRLIDERRLLKPWSSDELAEELESRGWHCYPPGDDPWENLRAEAQRIPGRVTRRQREAKNARR